ncbi:MAG TPA: UbiA prenyltransferase family protein [Phycisphaerae bacterium]|nr:UbiA prenyltransferase family protein [Phycisphaerae bacterium]
MSQAHSTDRDAGPRGAAALWQALRPAHWIKNAFVAAPLLFSMRFTDAASWLLTAAAVAAFCLASSAIYLINDLRDRDRDRRHPVKRLRPIASGRLAPGVARAGAVVLLGMAAGIVGVTEALTPRPSALLGGHALLTWTAAYVALNVLYTFWLKDLFVVDVLVVAFGFVLRAMAGAAAIAVPISPWLVVCTLSLCLFIALAKRRSELGELPPADAAAARPVNRAYDARQLDHMLTVSTAMAILTYTLYCLSPQTVGRLGSAHMVWTVPLVIYGMFRFERLTRRAGASDPVAVLVRDAVMWLVLAAYVLLTVAVLLFGDRPAVRDILLFSK